ncbi:hydrogenase maturation protease [Streptomyces sp. NPDC086091]|uniref:hydrogenase maturation protease n=1 Tax=Streptomyces sp. NPDC086091 TaxID=3365751 RepID=UPI00381F9660
MTGTPGPAGPPGPSVLVAGVGNVFRRDDGFGVETVERLALRGPSVLPDGVELMDAGIRGLHLAYRLLDGCTTLVLVDAVHRDGPPGTLYTLDAGQLPAADGTPAAGGDADDRARPVAMDGHSMDPAAVLRQARGLRAAVGGSLPDRVWVVGCEPGDVGDGLGLTPPVARAVEPAVDLVLRLTHDITRTRTRS